MKTDPPSWQPFREYTFLLKHRRSGVNVYGSILRRNYAESLRKGEMNGGVFRSQHGATGFLSQEVYQQALGLQSDPASSPEVLNREWRLLLPDGRERASLLILRTQQKDADQVKTEIPRLLSGVEWRHTVKSPGLGTTVSGTRRKPFVPPSAVTTPSGTLLPAGTRLVVEDGRHDRSFVVTADWLLERHTRSKFFFPENWGLPTALLPSADGRRLLLRRSHDALVLDADTLRLRRRLNTPCAWWKGSRLARLDNLSDGGIQLTVEEETRSIPLRDNTAITGVDSQGTFFLSLQSVYQGAGFPTAFRLALMQEGRYGQFRRLRLLTTLKTKDLSFSNRSATTIAAVDAGLAVFGLTNRGEDEEYELIGAVSGKRVESPLRTAEGRLVFLRQTPIVAENRIFALVEAWGQREEPTGDRYLLAVRRKGIQLTPVGRDIRFVQYDARHKRLLFGRTAKEGMVLEPVRIALKTDNTK